MKTMQEINKEIELLRTERNEKADVYYKVEAQTQDKIIKLEEKKRKLYNKFVSNVKKMFGIVNVEVYHGDYELKVMFDKKTLFKYNSEKLEYRLIGVQNGMKLKAMYEDIYGEPKESVRLFINDDIQGALDCSLNNLGPNDTVSITRRR